MNNFDIAVVGGGHAGIEAAVIAAKRGLRVALVSLEKNKIGLMSCNPAIGGVAKGQLVKEIDALGGAMGKIIDIAGVHFKMLNMSKGPAVQSPRAQADRMLYAKAAQSTISFFDNITVVEDMATGIIVKSGKVTGLQLMRNKQLEASAVVVTTGTFLNGIIHVGTQKLQAGRAGEMPASGMTESLQGHGFRSGRLKTGTPPRLDIRTIDFEKTEIQFPDETPAPFSYSTDKINQEQINCFITYTNQKTHDELRKGFNRSPMFTGRIKGVGPRYCPSIEDKIDRFSDKPRHQIFLEPEGYKSKEVYVNGFSTSLPGDVQEEAIKTVPGLESAKIIRLGYAVEYDFFPPDQLISSLETKNIKNLFFAGQINGTSGYEEAAAQGLIAGLNAALSLNGEKTFILKRSEAYIGVLIDDLINKIHDEPYRMFTSRAEFRLLLRQDNADLRLMEYGYQLGLVDSQTYKKLQERREEINRVQQMLLQKISVFNFNKMFSNQSSKIKQPQSIESLLKRPEVKLRDLLSAHNGGKVFSDSAINEVEYSTKYSGYLTRQSALIEKFNKAENKKIPIEFRYQEIKSLSTEAKEKLGTIKPDNLGQASRISGVTPADISVLMIYLEKYNSEFVSRETT